jgi:hypothetical protein
VQTAKQDKGRFRPVQLDALTLRVLNDPFDLPDNPKKLEMLGEQLSDFRQQCIASGKFWETQVVQRILRSIDAKMKAADARERQTLLQKKKFVEIQEVLGQKMQQWDSTFNEFMDQVNVEIDSLQRKQQSELATFDASCPDHLTTPYRKRSMTLIAMRDKERALAMNSRFLAAHRLKERSTALEDQEARLQLARMREDFLRRRNRLIDKHNEQMRVLMEHVDAARLALIKNRSHLIEGRVKRMGLIDESLGEEKIDVAISEERRKLLEEVESVYPIPPVRQMSFIRIRQRLRDLKQRPRTFRGTCRRDLNGKDKDEKWSDEVVREEQAERIDKNVCDGDVKRFGREVGKEEEWQWVGDDDEKGQSCHGVRNWGDDWNVLSVLGEY